jgi:hypothetical protein
MPNTPAPPKLSRSCHLGEHRRCHWLPCECSCHYQQQLLLARDRQYAARELAAYFREPSYAHAANVATRTA